MEVVVAIIVIAVFISTLVLTPFFLRSKERMRLIELVRGAAERGHPIPTEVLSTLVAEPKPQRPSHVRDTRRGVVLLAAALAVEIIALCFYASVYLDADDPETAAQIALVIAGFGALPLCIGLAFVLLGMTGKHASET